ncbi:MAG: prepilin-type N-terminal cleavage/methylation domain-containing protein [Verrucomicrobia bacterium]|nr:prepilin-type N-terminal cleavage/methylation domain-containing protein [Verrucomicrobiota bacterium]
MKKTNRKSGFTLVELMVVAAIIAILAAIIVPMLTSNKDRAIAAEASNILGMIATECKVIFASGSDWPSTYPDDLSSITEDEINNAKYFSDATITLGATSGNELNTWWVEIVGGGADFSGGDDLSLRLVSGGTFSGDMVDEKLISP